METFDLLVIGAGPTGMACAIEAQRAGFRAVVIDKGCLVNSLFHYPANMVFFTTPELLEIGDIPFTTATRSPTALRRWSITATWPSITGSTCASISAWPAIRVDGAFESRTQDLHNHDHEYTARKIVVATGYYDRPNYHEHTRAKTCPR